MHSLTLQCAHCAHRHIEDLGKGLGTRLVCANFKYKAPIDQSMKPAIFSGKSLVAS